MKKQAAPEGKPQTENSHSKLVGKGHIRMVGDVSSPSGSVSLQNVIETKLAERAYDDTIFSEKEPFTWVAEISNNVVDFYGTRMDNSTLDNFVTSLDKGIAFQHSHSHRDFIGHSLTGWKKAVDGRDSVFGVFYTIPDIQLGSIGTTDFINGVRSGIMRDVSVGIWANDVRCSICGNQMFDWWTWGTPDYCPHQPLEYYPVKNENGDPVLDSTGQAVMEMAVGEIINADLLEASAVYDGANPLAQIGKASDLYSRGMLSQRSVQHLESIYDSEIPMIRTASGTTALGTKVTATIVQEATNMGQQPKGETPEVIVQEVVVPEVTLEVFTLDPHLLERVAGYAFGGDGIEPALIIERALDKLDDLTNQVAELSSDAEVGKQYKTDLVEDAIKAGIRAKGESFKVENYRKVLSSIDIDQIKMMRDDWTTEGDEALRSSGDSDGIRRITSDNPAYDVADIRQRRERASHSG